MIHSQVAHLLGTKVLSMKPQCVNLVTNLICPKAPFQQSQQEGVTTHHDGVAFQDRHHGTTRMNMGNNDDNDQRMMMTMTYGPLYGPCQRALQSIILSQQATVQQVTKQALVGFLQNPDNRTRFKQSTQGYIIRRNNNNNNNNNPTTTTTEP